MGSRRRTRVVSVRPQSWFTNLKPGPRGAELEYLASATKQLRRYFSTFEAGQGFDLREIPFWSRAKVERVRRTAEDLRSRLARPHVEVSPKRYKNTKRRIQFRQLLKRETQELRDGVRRYIVQVRDVPRRQDVALSSDGTALERRDYIKPGQFVAERFWYFRDYNHGVQPVSFAEFEDAARRMLRDLQDGAYYRLFTPERGALSPPFEKGRLLRELTRYFHEYAQDFVETIIAVVFIGTRDQAMKGEQRRFRKAQERIKEKSKAAQVRRSRQNKPRE